MTPGRSRVVDLALGLFRRLTALMPQTYRQRHREEAVDLMTQLAADAYRTRGTAGVVAVTTSAILDLLSFLPALQLRRRLSALRRDVPYAVRALRRRPVASAAAITTLAIGIGLNAAVFSVVDWVLLRPLPYPAPHELVRIFSTGGGGRVSPSHDISHAEFLQLSGSGALRSATAFSTAARIMSGRGVEPVHVVVARVGGDLFGTLGVRPAMGRAIEPAETAGSAGVAVVSEVLWRRHLSADPAIAGRTITIDRQPLTVVGVMPAGRGYPHDADLWRPLTVQERASGDRELAVIGRLSPGTSPEQASAAIATMSNAQGRRSWVERLQRTEVRDVRRALIVLLLSSAAVLLMACANVAALAGARGSERAAEIAVRGALGASRGALIQQLLTEHVLLAAAGGAAGLMLGGWTLNLLIAAAPAGLPRLDEIALDGRVIAVGAAVTLLAGLLVGVAPAWRASRLDLRAALGRAGSARASGRGRRWLVAGQTAMALVVAVSAALLARSLQHLVTIDHGFAADRLLAVELSLRGGVTNDVRGLYRDLVSAAEGIPGVRAAAVSLRLPTQITSLRASIRGTGIRDAAPATAMLRPITRRYFETTAIPLLAGRPFAATDQRSTPRVAIVNAAFVRDLLGGASALGTTLTTNLFDDPFTVVGVAANVTPAGEPDRPALYVTLDQIEVPGGSLLLNIDGDSRAIVPELTARLKAIAPALARDRIHRVADDLAEGRAAARFNTQVVSSFAALAVLLAAIGVYGLTAGEIAIRRQELAVRMALGATRRQVLAAVMRPSAVAIGLGLAIGLVATLGAGRWMTSLLYGVTPTDPATLAIVLSILSATGLAAATLAAARVLRTDPAPVLRAE
jgi:predicted permease